MSAIEFADVAAPCALSVDLIQYQSVYDADYQLRFVRLTTQAENDSDDAASWPALLRGAGSIRMRDLSPLMLTLSDSASLMALTDAMLPANSCLEIAAPLLADTDCHQQLVELQANGIDLVAQNGVAPALELPFSLRQWQMQHNIRSLTELEQVKSKDENGLFIGWPVNGTPGTLGQQSGESNLGLVLDLLQRIDRAEHVDNIEPLLDNSPTLSYRLLRYLNSPAAGLGRKIESLRHAVMLVGYSRLKSWLFMLLATAVETPQARPLIDAAIRRAHLMQEFSNCLGINRSDGDMFVCGAFSLLDQTLGKSMVDLLETLPLSEETARCLKNNDGPYAPYLSLVRNLESAQVFDFPTACEETALSVLEINLAILNSLVKANATR